MLNNRFLRMAAVAVAIALIGLVFWQFGGDDVSPEPSSPEQGQKILPEAHSPDIESGRRGAGSNSEANLGAPVIRNSTEIAAKNLILNYEGEFDPSKPPRATVVAFRQEDIPELRLESDVRSISEFIQKNLAAGTMHTKYLEIKDEKRAACSLEFDSQVDFALVLLGVSIPSQSTMQFEVSSNLGSEFIRLGRYANSNVLIVMAKAKQELSIVGKSTGKLEGAVYYSGEALPHTSFSVQLVRGGSVVEISNGKFREGHVGGIFEFRGVPADTALKLRVVHNQSAFASELSFAVLALPFYYEFDVMALAPGEERTGIRLDIPDMPTLKVEVPDTPEFRAKTWRIEANYVNATTGRSDEGNWGMARGYIHEPGFDTSYIESPLGPEVSTYLSSQPLPLSYDWWLKNAPQRSWKQALAFTFLCSGYESLPVVYSYDYNVDLARETVIRIIPTAISHELEISVRSGVDNSPVESAKALVADVSGRSSGWKVSVETNNEGIARVVAPVANLKVSIRASGYASQSQHCFPTGVANALPSRIEVLLVPQKSASLTLNIADSSTGTWEMERDGTIWAMVVSDQPDPMRIMHQTWIAEAKEVDADGRMNFTNIPPGKYLVTVLANGRQPWVKELEVSRSESKSESFDVNLKALQPASTKVDFSSVSEAIGQSGGMKLGFNREFALVQGDFGAYASRIANLLRGEIVWKPVEGSKERQPYPFLPTKLLGETPKLPLEVELDPSLPTWLIGPSGAILPMVKDGDTYKPDASKTATLRGSVLGMTKFDSLIARVVPVDAHNAERSPYNVLSGVSTPIDKNGNWVVSHLLPGTYRVLLLKPNAGGDGASAVTVLNRNKNVIATLIAKEDQTINLEADQ